MFARGSKLPVFAWLPLFAWLIAALSLSVLPASRAAADDAIQTPTSSGTGPAPRAATALPPATTVPRSVDLPILVYHHVRPGSTSLLFVSPEKFDEQLKYLQDNGYHTISFTDLADYLEKGKPLPERPVIISLDDGWENQFEYGFPILQKYHASATFYVVTDYLDHENFMTTAQLKAMAAAGMAIGCHTLSHPTLTTLGRQRAWNEIAESKAILEQAGFKIDTFAYPYGAYNEAVVELVRAAGYRSARTVDAGTRATAEDLGTLPGMTFQTFLSSYRAPLELTSGEAPR